MSKMTIYICSVCFWKYDPKNGDPKGGIPPNTRFEDLPSDWICPVCGHPKKVFLPGK